MEVSPGLTIGSIHHTEPICRVFGYLLPVVTNARLISAAPEMLEKLIEIHTYFIDQMGESEGAEELAGLIAKARGE